MSSFSPTSGITGSQVTITGSGLGGATRVTFGSLKAVFSIVSASQITATVPNGALAGRISVITAAGTATSTASFTPTLSLTSLNPTRGPYGTVVTIRGVGFNSRSTVKFHGAAASKVTHVSSTRLRATVPAAARTGPVTVTNPTAPAGTVRSAGTYTVTHSPPL